MRYINKSKHLQEGLELIQDFLDNHCLDSNHRHSEVRYDKRDHPGSGKLKLCNSSYRPRLVSLLIDNQGPYCCYCLRKLKSDRIKQENSDECITLEHIIPRSTANSEDAAYYRSAPGLSVDDVEIRDVYESPAYTQKKHLHPHNVAYRNLVLSCAGTFPADENIDNPNSPLCCNEARKNKEAYPIYLHSDAADHVEYLKNGGIQAVPGKALYDKVKTMIENTELDCHSLKQIRKIWYLLRNVSWERISDADKSDEKRNSLLSEYLFADSADKDAFSLFEKFNKQKYWDTLMLYRLFHDIMKLIP